MPAHAPGTCLTGKQADLGTRGQLNGRFHRLHRQLTFGKEFTEALHCLGRRLLLVLQHTVQRLLQLHLALCRAL